MKQGIAKLAKAKGKIVTVERVDVQVGNKMDLSYAKIRQKYLDAIKSGVYQAILISPPCSTFSRACKACWRNFKGPRPVRSFKFPRGLRILTAVERRKCNLGNTFADWSCASRQTSTRGLDLSMSESGSLEGGGWVWRCGQFAINPLACRL